MIHYLSKKYALKIDQNWFRILKKSYRTTNNNFVYPSSTHYQNFVPQCKYVAESEIETLQRFMDTHRKLFILTGAGISTESGIPDYRSEKVGLYATSSKRPVQYIDFLKKADVRQRYWARNYVAWPRFSSFRPNKSHYILSEWEKKDKINWLVTQNVDALHYKAGSQRLTELHGSAHRVMCLSCNFKTSRHTLQKMFKDHNPDWKAEANEVRPDGHVDLESEKIRLFKVPDCPSCGGVLKPEITFFGDNVPKKTVHMLLEKMLNSDGVLVIGSSLEVYSGYRFVNRACTDGIDIAILNIGRTRGDKHATTKVSGVISNVLQRLRI